MKIKRFTRGQSIFQSCPDSKNEEVTMTVLLNFTRVNFFRKTSGIGSLFHHQFFFFICWFTPILWSQWVQRCLVFFFFLNIKLDSPPPEKTGSAQHQVETMSFSLSLIIIIVVFKDEHRCNPKPGN